MGVLGTPDTPIGESEMSNDGFKWNAFARIDKYDPEVVAELTRILGYEPQAADFARLGVDPNRVTEVEGNILVAGGLGALTNLFTGAGGQAFNQTRGIVGVGATSTAATTADTALGANGGSAWYQGIDVSPGVTRVTTNVTNDAVQCQSTFASGNANFAWNEWCWASSSSGTVTGSATLASVATGTLMLNHKIASMGTQASGASWVFTTKVTFS